MIIVHGTFPIKPEQRDDALSLMRQMASFSRQENGCLSYEFYVGLSNPNQLLLFQEWESIEALQDHFETTHMEEFMRALPDVLNGEVTTRRYEVRSSAHPEPEDEELESRDEVPEPPRSRIIH